MIMMIMMILLVSLFNSRSNRSLNNNELHLLAIFNFSQVNNWRYRQLVKLTEV